MTGQGFPAGPAAPMRPRDALLRLGAGLALAVGPYVAHVLPMWFRHDPLFDSFATAAAVYLACGALCGVLCSWWCIACAIAGVPLGWLVFKAAGFLEPGDDVLFFAFAVAFAVVFIAPGIVAAALARMAATRSSRKDNPAA